MFDDAQGSDENAIKNVDDDISNPEERGSSQVTYGYFLIRKKRPI